MPAVSKKQQRFFGMVRQAQKEGQAKASSPEVARVASRIKKSDAKDFASTKHKGLPEKKKMNEEGYDHLRDQGRIPPTKGKKDATTMPRSYKPSSPRKGKSALEIVKKSITDKYGNGAIMNLKKEGTAYGIYKGDGKMKIGAKKKEDKNKQEVKAVPADTMEGMYDIDPKTGKSPVASSVEKGNKKTGDKRLRHFAKLAKKMVGEAKVDKGRSDYGKASIRNYRRMGPGHGDPGMFDPEGKRGKTIDKRREEHKARRGVKGAKVPAYKREEVEVVNEVSPKTLRNYIIKGTQDVAKRASDPDSHSGPKYGKKMKRMDGVMTAADKLAKKASRDARMTEGEVYWSSTALDQLDAINEKDTALDIVKKKIIAQYGKGAIMKKGQPKKVKGAKSTAGTGKYKKMADQKKQTAADAKKRGFKNTSDYIETMARYGGKDNYDKGKGLGT